MTIKQLVNAVKENDEYHIDGVFVHQVRIIGTVLTREDHSTNCTYKISDGTGIFECKKWVEKESTNVNAKDQRCV